MDSIHGYAWRWVTDGTVDMDVPKGVRQIDLSKVPETEGVVALWMKRHGVHAALVRPDHYVFGSATNKVDAQHLIEIWNKQLH